MKIERLKADAVITRPGFYQMPPDGYHADPCDDASLNQTVAKILLARSPKHAWTAHPRLNLEFEAPDESKFDFGSAAHTMMLGEGNVLKVGVWDDWRKGDARQFRDDMRAAGFIPILEHQHNRVSAMVQIAHRQLGDVFDSRGSSEVIAATIEDGCWLRTMIDWIAPDGNCYDYKTTDMSVAPDAIPRMIVNQGWHIQAAFHERLLNMLEPDMAGRRKFRFIAQETELPHALTKVELTEAWLTIGRKMVDYAVATWKQCLKSGIWPSYPDEYIYPPLPGWHEAKVLGDEIERDKVQYLHDQTNLRRGGITPIVDRFV